MADDINDDPSEEPEEPRRTGDAEPEDWADWGARQGRRDDSDETEDAFTGPEDVDGGDQSLANIHTGDRPVYEAAPEDPVEQQGFTPESLEVPRQEVEGRDPPPPIDPIDPGARRQVGAIPVFGDDPRSLLASEDGKTVTTEFAGFDPAETHNPWNTEHTPGGSSSGSVRSTPFSTTSIIAGRSCARAACRWI